MGREDPERGKKERDRIAKSVPPAPSNRAVSNPEPDERPLWELLGSKKHVKVSMEAVYVVNQAEEPVMSQTGVRAGGQRTKNQLVTLVVLLAFFVCALTLDETRLLKAIIVAQTLWSLLVIHVRRGI